MRWLTVLVLGALLAGAGWYFASPWLAMRGLANAAATRDLAELEERIDFPALRAAARGELGGVTPLARGAFGPLAGLAAEQLGGVAIDAAISPQGMARLIGTGALAASLLPERLRGQDLAWRVERGGMDRFRAISSFADGTAGPVLLFERDGLGWRMTGLALPRYI